MQQDGDALRYVPDVLKSEELCLTAVQQDGSALWAVPETLLFTEKIVKVALGQLASRIDAYSRLWHLFDSLSEHVLREACEYVEEIAATVFVDETKWPEELAERFRKAKQRTDDALIKGGFV